MRSLGRLQHRALGLRWRSSSHRPPLPSPMADTEDDTSGIPIHCRAAVCWKAGEAMVIQKVIVAPPMPHEVRLRLLCSSLCQSDLTFWKMKDPPGCFPRIFGHEAVGVVESVGEEVDDMKKGDTVIPTFIPDCGECVDCVSESSNLCSKFPFTVSPWTLRYESSRFTSFGGGETVYHFLFVSSFSEYTVVDSANLIKIDPTIPLEKACLFSCGVSTGVGAAWKTAKVEKGSTVAIFGLGSVGLAVAEGARLCGAARIIGIDSNPEKFEVGRRFGVTEFINPQECGEKSCGQVVLEITGGADYCFECVGAASLVEEAFYCCRKGWGKTVVLGVDKPESEIKLKSLNVLHSSKTLTGCLLGGLKPKSDVPLLIRRYNHHQVVYLVGSDREERVRTELNGSESRRTGLYREERVRTEGGAGEPRFFYPLKQRVTHTSILEKITWCGHIKDTSVQNTSAAY